MAIAAAATGATLVHYSSDYVYHNNILSPLKETDPTTPVGVYAKTKLAGEKAIESTGCKYIIIRTSWVYSEFGGNFVKTMLRLAKDRDALNIVNDQIGSPTYATDLATDTLRMIAAYPYILEHHITVNYSNDAKISWYDFAKEIFDQSKNEINLSPIPTSEYPTPASRPKWSVLNLSTVDEVFDIQPKPWKESLKMCLKELN